MNLRKQVGPAVWLLVLLARFMPPDWDGLERVAVAGGTLVSDGELSAWLGVGPSTIANWRRRLKKAGLLDWLTSAGAGRVLFLRGISQAFAFPVQAGAIDSLPKAGDSATGNPRAQQVEANRDAQQTQQWLH